MPNILDLILTNEEAMVKNLHYFLGIGLSDHLALVFDMRLYTEQPKPQPRFHLQKAYYESMNTQLSEVDSNTELLKKFGKVTVSSSQTSSM